MVFDAFRSALARGSSVGRRIVARLGPRPALDDEWSQELLQRAVTAREDGRRDESRALYREVLDRRRNHAGALRGLRELAVDEGRWPEALEVQQRLCSVVGSGDRGQEAHWLAVVFYELGRAALAAGNQEEALAHLRNALRADREFLPAAVSLGDAHDALGDHREAVRVWERAAEGTAALPVLARLERRYRQEGRPSRMIALYRTALERVPDDLSLAVSLGRVYLDLEMLDEAADQFEKVEVHAPDLATVHAYLGAVFERRGETREALEEYRRALVLGHTFEWPHQCASCGVASSAWVERCERCGRWNTLRPVAG